MSLPALPVTADTRSITERVNVLIRDYNSGRVEDLAQALVDIAALLGLHDGDATTFLAGPVALNNTANFFNGPNTGSIGGAGQRWLLIGVAVLQDTVGAATVAARLHDGTNIIAGGLDRVGAANQNITVTVCAVVTLPGPTTFTLQARDITSVNGFMLSTSAAVGGSANHTSITAVRLA